MQYATSDNLLGLRKTKIIMGEGRKEMKAMP